MLRRQHAMFEQRQAKLARIEMVNEARQAADSLREREYSLFYFVKKLMSWRKCYHRGRQCLNNSR